VFVVATLSSLLTVGLLLAILAGAGATQAKPALESGGVDSAPAAAPGPAEPAAPDPNDLGEPAVPAVALESVEPKAAPKYLHISGSVFAPLYGGTQFTYAGSGCMYASGGGNPYLNYGLVLPYDATVATMRLYYKDTNASQNAFLWLAQYDDGLAYTYIATATTTTSSGWGSVTVNVNKQLDYDNYSYTLVWSQQAADSSLQLCGFRIGYTAPGTFGAALPLVTNDYQP
jgi:hypothetical protein